MEWWKNGMLEERAWKTSCLFPKVWKQAACPPKTLDLRRFGEGGSLHSLIPCLSGWHVNLQSLDWFGWTPISERVSCRRVTVRAKACSESPFLLTRFLSGPSMVGKRAEERFINLLFQHSTIPPFRLSTPPSSSVFIPCIFFIFLQRCASRQTYPL